MNILLSAYNCDPSRGSEPGLGWNWAYGLTRAGHRVWVVTIPWGKAGIEKFLASTPMPGLTVVYVDIPHFPVRFLVGKYSAKYRPCARPTMAASRVDSCTRAQFESGIRCCASCVVGKFACWIPAMEAREAISIRSCGGRAGHTTRLRPLPTGRMDNGGYTLCPGSLFSGHTA